MIAYIEHRLPAAPLAVPLARHGVAVSLLPELPEESLERVLLLTTEAVSEALAASAAPWKLRVDVDDDGVLVSVRYVPRPGTGTDDELRDVLFAALSSSFGTEQHDGEIERWFRVDD